MSPNPAANQDFQNAISLTLLLRSVTRCWLQHRCSSTAHLHGLSLVVSGCADSLEYWTAAIVLQWTASWQLMRCNCYCHLAVAVCDKGLFHHTVDSLMKFDCHRHLAVAICDSMLLPPCFALSRSHSCSIAEEVSLVAIWWSVANGSSCSTITLMPSVWSGSPCPLRGAWQPRRNRYCLWVTYVSHTHIQSICINNI